MKLSKDAKTITIEREVFEMIIRHLQQFEKVVKEFEREEKNDEVPALWQKHWLRLKRFLVSEELEGSNDGKTDAELDGRYCCRLIYYGSNPPITRNCRDYNAWYAFALAACAAEALLAGWSSQMSSGRCKKRSGCPQYRP
jgi:hypothetical protein